MNSLLTKIENQLNQLTEAERQIGKFIIENAKLVPNMTTKDLSEKTGVSEASVVRFCKSIGMKSFKSFKLELVKDLTLSETDITDFSILQKKDSPYDLFHKVTYVNKHAIESTLASLDKNELNKAVESIKGANKIIFFGVGGSATAAFDGHYKFTRLGFHSIMTHDFHYLITLIPYLSKGDIFVAISMSGKTKDVIELAQFAKKNGATLIAITNIDKSPLYKEADIRLCTPNVEQDFRIGTIASRMTQLNIIDTLYLSVFNSIGEKLVNRYHMAREEAVRLRR
ncbi:RpiR family transcriptional regulator [Heyndrickxia shackletonii]|uniref:RpiR family transcriptional regulator n=1 Tax=Heyndrickxia shackletonii TaxID=157838 RepID=A0A0Q3WTY7_9BACI|nr:MurR/RpiR family transcriptional regulator [Heyndrickxia shackletonii]KQL51181.1 RpiR family transcriptional regulator [Heyndrickxia shackletonii]MBB2479065.1 MurR/RpiR family transcriptional regulator [Bacillus sp. APMAM]NEZ00580.1 MurR/RpiR family transcriptional regulator [Heyndrickxia shackletonii]RTZ57253.1 MurR/RpiR family transcriptional regulator [Bacillus sp. SAJ1]